MIDDFDNPYIMSLPFDKHDGFNESILESSIVKNEPFNFGKLYKP